MQRQRWPDETKQQAIEYALANGTSAAARETGVPEGTIASWLNRSGRAPASPEARADGLVSAQLAWEERRTIVAERLGAVAQKATAVLLEKLEAGDVTVHQVLEVLEAAVSKSQLLTGAAQSRTESTVTNTKTQKIAEARERAGILRAA